MKLMGKVISSQSLLLVLLVILVALFFRWNSFNTPFERDEGEYAYSAWIMAEDKAIPYRDAFLQKPPMIIYTYLLAYIISPDALWPSRFLAFICVVLSALLVAYILKKEFDPKIGWIGAVLTVIGLSAPFYTALAANTELFLIPPLLGVVALYVTKKEKAQYRDWFFAGVLSAISLLYKPIGLYILLFVFTVWLYKTIKAKAKHSLIIQNLLSAFFGVVITMSIVLLPFLVKGAVGDLVETAVVFNAHYAKMWGINFEGLSLEVGRLFKYWWILPLTSLAFIFNKYKDGWFYPGLMFISLLSVFQSIIGHYYLLLIPFLVILVTVGLENISQLIEKQGKKVSLTTLSLAVVFLTLWPVRVQFGLTSYEIGKWIYGDENPFNEAVEVGRKVQDLTDKDETIFVGGSEPEIYYYAKRQSASRFVITYPLNLNTALRENYQRKAIEDLKNNPPGLIVVSRMPMSGLWDSKSPRIFIDYFYDLIENDYLLKGSLVRNNKNGYWSDTPTEEEVANSTYLVFVKR